MSKISIADQPIQSVELEGRIIPRLKLPGAENPDRLGTGGYAVSLAEFIRSCETPMTIGIQGEWGSGKTSLLNMIREDIEEAERTHYKSVIKGSEEYKTIWVNTWEHSLMRTPEECLLSIIEEIIEEIAEVDGNYKTAERAKKALAGLAQGALKVGAGMAFGSGGYQVADELLAPAAVNKIKMLRQSLEAIVESVVSRDHNKVKRFIVFIDDLDRLEPSIAVLVLELLKNVFTIPNCVFVLAIDYQVVVKGLKGKFGEQTEENEWEFRAFFDKIIQLPFMMPMATYDLKNYITSHLLDIQYFQPSEKFFLEDGRLTRVVSLTLGHNPRSMKRLLNALSLIKLHNRDAMKETITRQLVFALVCCQISLPRVYELLLREPDFSQWDSDFVDRMTGGPEENLEVTQALNRAMQVNEDDFDEEWEQVLFKIVWRKGWDRNRLPESSRLLSEIKDKILAKENDEDFSTHMVSALKMTAVTAVVSTDEGIFSRQSDQIENTEALDRNRFWQRFSKAMTGSDCAFDPNENAIRRTHTSGYLSRNAKSNSLQGLAFVMSTRPAAMLKISSAPSEPEEAYKLFSFLKLNRKVIEAVTESKVSFKIGEERSNQVVNISPHMVTNCQGTLDLPENEAISDKVFEWLKVTQPKLEARLSKLIDEEFDLDAFATEIVIDPGSVPSGTTETTQ